MTSSSEAHHALRRARSTRTPIAPFTDADATLAAEWGYAVQDLHRAERLDAGERVIGAKLGLTSRAKQDRMGVAVPIVGFLTDAHLMDAATLDDRLGQWCQPRIEPEIAFLTRHDITGAMTRADALAAVEAIALAAEIIDSRFLDYRFRLADVVADNTSAAGVILGPARVTPDDAGDLAALTCTVTVGDEVVHTATGAAILGDPVLALVNLTEHLAHHEQTLPAGSWVLAGALTDAVPLESGHRYRLEVSGLGAVSLP